MIEPEKHLLDDESISKYTKQYLSKEKKDPLNRITLAITSLDSVRSKAKRILSKSVTGKRISRLGADSAAERWVDSGRPLHENKDVCLFCGQPLPPDLMDSLKEHFSAEYDLLMSDVSDLRRVIEGAEKEEVSLPHPTEFYPELAAEYSSERVRVERLVQERLTSLGKLAEAAEAKQSKAFASLECPEIEDPKDEIVNHIAEINRLIDLHNKRTTDFERSREAALLKLEMYAAATFVVEQDYGNRGLVMERLRAEIKSAESRLAILENDIKMLESETSEAARGAEQINSLLKAYFGKEEIKIMVSEAGEFHILRDGLIAKNLSEGEKTAIAFSYFITRVQDGKTALDDMIVVVDDPISSLDANHLFNTYALIKTQIGACKQLFLSTHSFELFNLLKEWATEKESSTKQFEKWRDWRFYLVRRGDDGRSRIENIAPVLMRFKSEYHYLFGELYRFARNVPGDFDRLYSLPNVTRRFMEAFGGIMIPKSQGLVGKMDRLFSDAVERERVWKFINHYSHQTTVMRSLTIPDIAECGAVVNACLTAVRVWNKEYFRDLESEIPAELR